MIWIRGEGEPIRFGLNIYPSFEWRFSRGFILDLGFYHFRFRYSPQIRKWFIGWERQTSHG